MRKLKFKKKQKVKERDKVKERKRKRVVLILGIVGVLLLVVAAGSSVFFVYKSISNFVIGSHYYDIREVKFEGVKNIKKNELVTLTDVHKGSNLFEVDLESISGKLEMHPLIKEAIVSRRLPKRVHVAIIEREPIALISLDKLYGLDDEGIIIPVDVADLGMDLPVFTGAKMWRYKLGKKNNDSRIRMGLRLLKTYEDSEARDLMRISEINLSDVKNPVIYTEEDKIEIRLGSKDYASKFDSLKKVLEDLKKKGQSAEYIDLRFGEESIFVKPRT